MCLALPHRILSIDGNGLAVARSGRSDVEVRLDLVDDVAVGDRVLVHAGFAIEKLAPEDGQELESLFAEVRRLGDQ
ncbi:MAG: HypC/HybG/HupF family hydrogenase formation chaperone [Synergistaceae bacterium]|nr:HypC/HybG/HupF family hydrogenase formation chaperone [Synergistaceae bacterium]